MIKVGLQVMSTVLLPLVCGSCATHSGILYGSKIELKAGSGRGNESKAKIDEVGLFFSGKFGRIELGQEDGAEDPAATSSWRTRPADEAVILAAMPSDHRLVANTGPECVVRCRRS